MAVLSKLIYGFDAIYIRISAGFSLANGKLILKFTRNCTWPRIVKGILKMKNREGTYEYLWLIHVDVWQKPTQFCKAFILQLKKNKSNNSLPRIEEYLPSKRKENICPQKTLCIAALFIITKRQKPTNWWVNKWNMESHTAEYYLAIKMKYWYILQFGKTSETLC